MHAKRLFVGLVLIATLLPVLIGAARLPAIQRLVKDELPWPVSFEGRALKRLPLSAVDQRFADRFPGQIGRFTDGRGVIIMRAVEEPTRMLHSAAVCFRGLGYRVESAHAVKDAGGNTWGCFAALRGGTEFSVCERIYDTHGEAWNDVSSWYWAANLGRTQGPWYAITVVSTP